MNSENSGPWLSRIVDVKVAGTELSAVTAPERLSDQPAATSVDMSIEGRENSGILEQVALASVLLGFDWNDFTVCTMRTAIERLLSSSNQAACVSLALLRTRATISASRSSGHKQSRLYSTGELSTSFAQTAWSI